MELDMSTPEERSIARQDIRRPPTPPKHFDAANEFCEEH
jgi:hypothetical protein